MKNALTLAALLGLGFAGAANAATSNCMVFGSSDLTVTCDGKVVKKASVGDYPDFYNQASKLLQALQAQGYSIVAAVDTGGGDNVMVWTLQK